MDFVLPDGLVSSKPLISQTEARRAEVTCLGPPTGEGAPSCAPGGRLALGRRDGHFCSWPNILSCLHCQGMTFF